MLAGSEGEANRERPSPGCLRMLLSGVALLLIAACLGAPVDGVALRTASADAPPPPPPPAWTPSGRQPTVPAVPVQPAIPARPRAGGRVPAAPPPPAWPGSRTRPAPGQPVLRDIVPPQPAPPNRGPAQPIPPRPAPPGQPQPSQPRRPAPPAQPAPPGLAPSGGATSAEGRPGPALSPGAVDARDPAAARPFIRRIEFEGNLLYASEMLKTRLRNKEGTRLDPVMLDLDMEELYRYFRDIQVVEEQVAGGIILRFRVSENPLILKLDIRGNDALDNAEVRNLLRTREGFPLSPYHLAADREDVEEAYRLQGHHFANVPEPEVITLPGGGRRVIFTVVEGPAVAVSRIVFRGNSHLAQKDLLEVMLTETPNFIENIIGDLVFRQHVLEQDLVAIKQLYRSEGFLDAEVALDDLRFSDDKSRVEISISIIEHQPYTVGNVEFEVERLDPGKVASPTADDIATFTDEGLQALYGLKSGERFSGKKAAKGLKEIRETYFKRSFLNAAVGHRRTGETVLRGREKELVVDLVIPINEGPKFRLARIDFVGNEYTRDRILRREVKTGPGGYVDRNKLDRGLAGIRRLNYFDRATLRLADAVGPNGEVIEGWKQATYEVVEGSTGNVSFGVSLATDGGLAASIQFQKRNFDITRWPTSLADIESGRAWTGAGQEFDLLLNPGTQVSQFRLRFREPRVFGSKYSFEVSLYRRIAFRDGYEVDRTGYSLGIGYPLFRADDDTLALLSEIEWRHELVDLDDIDPDSIPGAFLFENENEIRSLAVSLSMVTRDDFIKPTFETQARLSAEYMGGQLGGDLNMWSVSGRGSATWLVHEDDEGKKHRLIGRVNAGIAEAFDDTPEVPPYERFFAGGRTFRGFDFRGVGPHANNKPTGGEFMLTTSLEYEFPLVRRTLSIVAFTDQGTLASSIGSSTAWKWRVTAGLGLRFAIPFLLGDRPIALDFAWPIFSEDEDEPGLFSFSLGRDL